MKILITLFICLINFLPPKFVSVENSIKEIGAEWSAIIYDHGLNALVTLSPSGQEVTDLPNVGYQPRPFENIPLWYFYKRVEVTDNRHYLVSIVQRTEPYVKEAIITDLNTQETQLVATPPLDDEEVFVSYHFGAFNSEMTQVALGYVSHDLTSGLGCCDSGGIVTVDLATGAITHSLDIDAVFNKSTAWLHDWTTEGIWFSPRCSTCTPEYTFFYKVWNPNTDMISNTNIFNDVQYAERLAATGELLYSANHPDFPLGGPMYPQLLNTVILYQIEEYPLETPGQVVYYDRGNLDSYRRSHWVMSGRAFVVTKSQHHNVVVFRDGRQLMIDYDSPEYFITMTGEGWLTIDRTTGQVKHYSVSDETITEQTLYHARGEIALANIQLPHITADELPPFEIDITPPDDIFCPGALPTRLKPGDWAEVTVWHESAIFSLALGDVDFSDISWDNAERLPIGTLLQVLEGPACHSNGWSYVKVAYGDKIGWILELWQTSYYLQPVTP